MLAFVASIFMAVAGRAQLTVRTFAGTAEISGHEDGAGIKAQFNSPADVAVNSGENLFVADTNNNTIRMISPGGVVTTLAGQVGVAGSSDGLGTAATFNGPSGIVAYSEPTPIPNTTFGEIVFVSDTLNHTIRSLTPMNVDEPVGHMVRPNNVVTTIAGTAGASGAVDGTGSAARFNGPQGLVLDSYGNLFIADTVNSTIRELAIADNSVTTVAGQAGLTGNSDGANLLATFHYPASSRLPAGGSGNLPGDTFRAIARWSEQSPVRHAGPGVIDSLRQTARLRHQDAPDHSHTGCGQKP